MHVEILCCTSCSAFTLHSPCSCGHVAVSPVPAKWSVGDAYGSYRRAYKRRYL